MEEPANKRKLLAKAKRSPHNLHFTEFEALIEAFGFRFDRQSGSHRIYSQDGVAEMVNIQDFDGKAKPVQVRDFLDLVERYHLTLRD